jgi:hypothetical protein
LFEICRATEDTMASWHAVQRERAELCKALGLNEGASAAELRTYTTELRAYVTGHAREHVVFAHELALLLRCPPELPAIVAAVRGRVEPGLDAVQALGRQFMAAIERLRTQTDGAIGSYGFGYAMSWLGLDVFAAQRPSDVVEEMVDLVSRTPRLCPVRLVVKSEDGNVCNVTFPASEAVKPSVTS